MNNHSWITDSLNEAVNKHPEWATYIHLCVVLQGTGASLTECRKYFKQYMPEDEYDESEEDDFISYLHKIAQNQVL